MLRNESGMSIVVVFGVMVILGLLAFALIFRTTGERQVVSYLTRREIAFNAAEACLDLTIGKILETDNVSPIPAPPDTWATLSNNALYKTGLPGSPPEEITIQATEIKELEDTKLQYITYGMRTSGKARQAVRSLEAAVIIGPLKYGTEYSE
ncbi:hypothetical protein CH333_02845 [candidate division WOR-3 bacterium JGI_Cruoil_03_44_89]|uniref:Type 4 fimbrial biogenesis protein PilX N-terminal domain-containing protein n=1 Tax=candidate division WOR-3 bacterium JGI_Cruoil_03_44_89 TaxID=1973748 RepID=A0A235BYR2_UNCW3|nr:MAG: hypothetical protein CH333_02845 [candidate division WOR-3 bacterium JGI_Cruoil_03_44_89]